MTFDTNRRFLADLNSVSADAFRRLLGLTFGHFAVYALPMWGRFTNRYTWRELVELYRLTDQGDDPGWQPSFNIAPTEVAPVIRVNRATGERKLSLLQWGLVPFWAKDPKIAYSTINARAETVAEKPAFREAYQRRRCLVPTSGFYEWREDGTKTKQPYHFTRADGQPLTLAGLWERWRKGDAEPLETFTIIVGGPTPQVEAFHDRSPVVLEPADFAVWLDHDVGSQALTPLLQPWRGEFAVAAVSKAVNSPKNEGAHQDGRAERSTRCTVPDPIPRSRAILSIPLPSARAFRIASSTLVATRGRPSCFPSALARANPAFTRSRIISRSNSAKTPIIWNSALPPGVVVSTPCLWR